MMLAKSALFASSIFVASAALLPSVASAAPVVIGSFTPGTNNGFPFSQGFAGNSRYQQVYSRTAFSGLSSISSVTFFADGFTNTSPGRLAGGTYALSISTTSASVDGLNTSNFASNVGSDNQSVFSGTLTPNFSGNRLTFNFSSPFAFNPAAGNLLLDFSITGFSQSATRGGFVANNGDAAGIFSRAHNFGSGFSGFGLTTEFNVNALAGGVPEPSSWALMIIGFGAVGGAMRSRKKVSVRFAA